MILFSKTVPTIFFLYLEKSQGPHMSTCLSLFCALLLSKFNVANNTTVTLPYIQCRKKKCQAFEWYNLFLKMFLLITYLPSYIGEGKEEETTLQNQELYLFHSL